MVVVEPQVVEGKTEGLDTSPLEVVEYGLHDGQSIQHLIFFQALAMFINLVELGTLHTVVLCLVTGLTLPGTISFTDVVFLEDVFDTVRGF